MKKTLTEDDFMRIVSECETRRDQFTLGGWRALFQLINQYEESTGDEVEMDIIALCCEYSEYPSAWDAMKEYQPDDMPTIDLQEYSDTHNGDGMSLGEISEAQEKAAREWLEERTQVTDVEGGGIVIQSF